MFGIAGPELLVLALVVVVLHGVVMAIDALRRPPSGFRVGSKLPWVAALVLLNPLLSRFFGGTVWLATLLIFPCVTVAYHWLNRRAVSTVTPDGTATDG
jgi:hypothetical protein